MTSATEVYGIIIRVSPVGDYDKRIIILSKERGKITAFARGARRQGSQLMGVTRVFATGTFKLFEGRDAYNLQSAQIDNYFEELVNDVGATCYGTYFLEMADYYAREYISEPQMIKLLYLSLRALTKKSIPNRLVRRIFELRLMMIGGEYDQDPTGNVSEGTIYTWKYICTSPLEKLYTFVVEENILIELEKSLDRMLDKYMDRKMNSLEILNTISGDKN